MFLSLYSLLLWMKDAFVFGEFAFVYVAAAALVFVVAAFVVPVVELQLLLMMYQPAVVRCLIVARVL